MVLNRIVYALTGVLALYFAVIPALSSFQIPRPLWMSVLLWVALACLFAASMFRFKGMRVAAVVGSGLVLWVFIGYPLAARLAVRLGYMHVKAQLVAFGQTWIDWFRIQVERQVWYLLLTFSVVSFCLSVRSLVIEYRSAR